MVESNHRKPFLDDGRVVDPQTLSRLEAELTPRVLEDERKRGEAIILSCLTPAERAILDGDDSIFGYPPVDNNSAPPDKT
jgi:hypothetical protein